MLYDLVHLKELANKNMAIAEENLRRDGFVQTCGLIYTRDGLSQIVTMQFGTLDEKRLKQEAFRSILRRSEAIAAAVIMEAWIKTFNVQESLDISRSLENMPGRQEAIVIELRSDVSCYGLVKVFHRQGLILTMKKTTELNPSQLWMSEWLSGVWPDRQDFGETTIPNAS